MGLPIGRIALACNANRVLPDFFAGGEYRATTSIATLANAMDVGAPSNFERLRWWQPDAAILRQALEATTVSDNDIRDAIADAEARAGCVICPHTAAAWHALGRRRAAGDTGDWAVVATAHPAKFETVVEPIIGRPVPVPPALAALLARSAHAEPLPADAAAFRARLLG
jgi:threonine synthase